VFTVSCLSPNVPGMAELQNYFVKTKSDFKSYVWQYFGRLVDKQTGCAKDGNVYCTKCFDNGELKSYKDTVSTTNLSQHLRDCHSILFS